MPFSDLTGSLRVAWPLQLSTGVKDEQAHFGTCLRR